MTTMPSPSPPYRTSDYSPVPGYNALMDGLPWATPRRVNAVLNALAQAGYTLLYMPRGDSEDMPPGSLDYEDDEPTASAPPSETGSDR